MESLPPTAKSRLSRKQPTGPTAGCTGQALATQLASPQPCHLLAGCQEAKGLWLSPAFPLEN